MEQEDIPRNIALVLILVLMGILVWGLLTRQTIDFKGIKEAIEAAGKFK
jgi:biopolymer transport protein ExbB/TolQ